MLIPAIPFRRHGDNLGFFLRPLIMSGLAAALWYYVFRTYEWHVPDQDMGAFGVLLGALSTLHAIIAGAVITMVWSDYEKFCDAAQDGSMERMKRLLSRRMPRPLRWFLLMLSVNNQIILSLFPYTTDWVGIIATASLALVLTFFYEVAYVLDNPIKAVWYREILPTHFFTGDPTKPPQPF